MVMRVVFLAIDVASTERIELYAMKPPFVFILALWVVSSFSTIVHSKILMTSGMAAQSFFSG